MEQVQYLKVWLQMPERLETGSNNSIDVQSVNTHESHPIYIPFFFHTDKSLQLRRRFQPFALAQPNIQQQKMPTEPKKNKRTSKFNSQKSIAGFIYQ